MAPIHALQQSAPVDPIRFGTLSTSVLDTRPTELVGERVFMRRLRITDLTKIEEHLLDLCRIDRAMRFLGTLSDEVISSYARHLDPSTAIMVGVCAPCGRLLGFAEAEPTEATGVVEIAVTVAHDFRRKGLGRALVAQAIALSFIEGARIAEFNFCPSNKAIVCLISSLGGRFGPPIGKASISRGSKAGQRMA